MGHGAWGSGLSSWEALGPRSSLGARPSPGKFIFGVENISRTSNTSILLKSTDTPKPQRSRLGCLGPSLGVVLRTSVYMHTCTCFGVICVGWGSEESRVAVGG